MSSNAISLAEKKRKKRIEIEFFFLLKRLKKEMKRNQLLSGEELTKNIPDSTFLRSWYRVLLNPIGLQTRSKSLNKT